MHARTHTRTHARASVQTLEPEWNESFSFVIGSGANEDITLEIWDEDQSKRDDFMGEVLLGTVLQLQKDHGNELQNGVVDIRHSTLDTT